MNSNEMNNETEIDLRELWFELLAHWKLILISTVLCGVIAAIISFFLITPKYESTAKLYIDTSSSQGTSLSDLQTGTNLANDYVQIVVGNPVLEKVIENLDLDETYRSLLGKVKVTNPTNSRILVITVDDTDPELAKTIVNEITKATAEFITDTMNQTAPTVIQTGTSDEGPVSPNKKRNTLIGALAGFVLAAAFVIIAHLVNDTVMTPDDLENKVGIHVLGTLPFDVEEDDGDVKKKKKKKVPGMSKKK